MHEMNPINSLKITTDASIQHVKQLKPSAIDIFCLLGLLPGGATKMDMNFLTRKNKEKDWELLVSILKQYSLVIEKEDHEKTKYMLSVPIMNIYAVSLLSEKELKYQQDAIIEFLLEILKDIYSDLQVEACRTKDKDQSKLRNAVTEYESNIWQCIYRLCRIHHDHDYD
jgi:hypothetical protein